MKPILLWLAVALAFAFCLIQSANACDTDGYVDEGTIQSFEAPMLAYGYGGSQQAQFAPQFAPQYDACQQAQQAPVIVQQAPRVVYQRAPQRQVIVRQQAPVVYRQQAPRVIVQRAPVVYQRAPQRTFIQRAPDVGFGGGSSFTAGRKLKQRVKIKNSPGATVGF